MPYIKKANDKSNNQVDHFKQQNDKIAKKGGCVLSIQHLLKDASAQLKGISDSPLLDAELLLAYCLGKSQTHLYTWPEKEVNESQINCFKALINKRLDDYPVAYLVGMISFWTLDFIVTPDVLIPRPETELLVETALEIIKDIDHPQILDLGTGSGAIALALASERPDAEITATDYSKASLAIAAQNAINNNLEKQLTFIKSDWFNDIKPNQFDLIISNPPYIDATDPHLLKTIRHEPQHALVASKKGFQDIEIIIENSPCYLKKNSWLILEHGYTQGHQTLELFNQHGSFTNAHTKTDLANNPRLSCAKII